MRKLTRNMVASYTKFVALTALCFISLHLLSTHRSSLAHNYWLATANDSVPFSNISVLYSEMKKKVFDKQFLSAKKYNNEFTIPKKLHFIWIGQNILEKYVEHINKFAVDNPNYQVILWGDNATLSNKTRKVPLSEKVEVKKINFVTKNMKALSLLKKLKTVGPLSDLLRYQLIYLYGGIYMDTDTISVQPLGERFHNSFVSYTLTHFKNICSSIFGFPQGSMFLEFVLNAAEEHYNSSDFGARPVWEQFGPSFFTTAFVQYNEPRIRMINQDYLTRRTPSNVSITIQTNDGSWISGTHVALSD